MGAVQLSIPVRPWVPRWLGIVTAFVVLLPIMLINGAYTGNMLDVSNALGVLSEDISMAYYSASAGMAVAYPLVPKIRTILTTKTVLLCDLFLQIVLSLVCARTSHIDVVIVCSFLIGLLKAFAMLEVISMIKPFLSPGNIRSEFYAYFYPLVFSAGQVSMVLTAQLAYTYQWQYMYYFVILLLLVAIVFVLAFFRYGRTPITFPFREIDWIGIAEIAAVLLMTIFVFTYGKTLDWFASRKISVFACLIPLLLFLFLRRQRRSAKPYIRLEVLKSRKAVVGYLYMMLAMFFSSSSTLITNYTTSVLRLDSIHVNRLYLWMIPGFVVAAALCFWWFRLQCWRFRTLVFWGLFCFSAYLGLLYFGLTPGGTYEYLYLPMFFRGAGMMILFIAFGVFVVEDLDPKLMIYNAFFLIACRSVLAPALSSSFFSNALYRLQQQSLHILAEGVDLLNPLAASRYTSGLQSALAGGHSLADAQLLATNGLYTTLQVQSLLLSIKILAGSTLLVAVVLMIVSRFIPFHKTLKVKAVKTGEDMV